MSNFILFFSLSLGYSALILALTMFFIHRQTKKPLWPITAFGSGALLPLILLDFLPHALEADAWHSALLLILTGFLVNAFSEMVLLPRVQFLHRLWPTPQKACQEEHMHYHFQPAGSRLLPVGSRLLPVGSRLLPSSTGCSAVACLILCAFFDGLRLAGATMLDFKTALVMGLSLLFHLLPESVAVLGIGLSAGLSKKALVRMILLFCFAFLLGYQALFLLSHIEAGQAFLLPFACGLFLYVSCVHLIPITFKLRQIRPFFMGLVLCSGLLWVSRTFGT